MVYPHNVVFVFNRFYQGRKELGPTSSWELTWLNSVESYFKNSFEVFNPDFFGPDSNVESDYHLLKLIDKVQPKTLIMINHIGHKWKREFISLGTLEEIQSRGVDIVCIWGDIHIPEQRHQLKSLAEVTTLNLCSASEAIVSRLNMRDKVQYVWVPIYEKTLDQSQKCKCNLTVSFAGSLKEKRASIVSFLNRKGIEIHTGGGEGSKALTREEYIQLIAHPITISFAGTFVESVTNARTFEALSQQSLLLEKWGTETCKLFRPYVDYVPWYSKRDLKKKIEYYTKYPEAAQKIATSGRKKLEQYSNARLWNMVYQRLENPDFKESKTQSEFKMNLKRVPFPIKQLSLAVDYFSRRKTLGMIFDFANKARDKFLSIFS